MPFTASELANTTRGTPASRAASKQLSMPRMFSFIAVCGACSLPRKYDRLMIRLGFAFTVAAMTSSNCVTSPRITRTCLPRSSNDAAPGLMSMHTISSPRAASRQITRKPMKPVPPMTKIAMFAPPVWLSRRDGPAWIKRAREAITRPNLPEGLAESPQPI